MKLSGIAQPLEKQFNDLLKMDPTTIMQTKAPEFLKIAALEQLNKARQPNPQPPQGTVAEQVVKQAVGVPPTPPMGAMPPGMPPGAPPMGAAPPMPPIEQGIANLPPPPPAAPPIEQGLASLPAGNMQFSDGGIVSFAEGGYEDPVDAYERRRKFYEETGEYYPDPSIFEDIHALSGLSKLQPEKHYSDKSPVARALREPELRPTEVRTLLGIGVNRPEPEPEPKQPFSMDKMIPPVPEYGAGLGLAEAVANVPKFNIPQAGAFPKAPERIIPEKFDLATHKKGQEDMDQAYGVDPEFWKKQGESLKEQLASRQKEFTSDKWLALAEAGARMAQTPGTFGQALGAGMETGLGSLKTAARDFRQDKQEMQEIQNKLQMAQQAEARGRSEDAQRMKMSADEQYRNAINQRSTDEFQRNMAEFEFTEGRKMTEAEAQLELDKALYNAKVKLKIAQADNASKMSGDRLALAKELLGVYSKERVDPEDIISLEIAAREQAEAQLKEDEKFQDAPEAEKQFILNKRTEEILKSQISQIRSIKQKESEGILGRSGLGWSMMRAE